jgi:hypothetical protein
MDFSTWDSKSKAVAEHPNHVPPAEPKDGKPSSPSKGLKKETMLLADVTQGTHDDGNQPSKVEFFTPT